MNFQIGDNVVHCAHGLGKVMAIEERTFSEITTLYYMVEVADMTIWVPADDNLKNRLRPPTSESGFRKFLSILSGAAEKLPDDRRQRNLQLMESLRNGGVESLCRVIRDLSAHRHTRTWSEYDSALIRRAQKALIGEWSFIFSISPLEAENELQRLLAHKAE